MIVLIFTDPSKTYCDEFVCPIGKATAGVGLLAFILFYVLIIRIIITFQEIATRKKLAKAGKKFLI